MRFTTVAMVMAALLGAGAANAAEGPKGAGDTGKGGGGPGGAGAGQLGGEGGGATGVETGNTRDNPDVANALTTAYKPWEVGVVFTTHRLIEQGDQYAGQPDPVLNVDPGAVTGSGVNKQINDYQMYARYDLTKNDRIGVKAFVYEYFLADQGENGVRFDDMLLSYTHTFRLPRKFRLQTGVAVSLPTSYLSQLEGLITSIGGRVDADRRFGPVSLSLGLHDTAFIEKYDSFAGSGGLAPTALNTLSIVAEAEFHMPFHEPLSIGLDAFIGYAWYNNIQSGVNANCTGSGNTTKDGACGGVSDGTFGQTEPIQETYGWEAYTRYLLPDLFGFKSDLTFAYSFGDAATGYTSLLQDGIGHVFLGYRHNSELYLSMAVRY